MIDQQAPSPLLYPWCNATAIQTGDMPQTGACCLPSHALGKTYHVFVTRVLPMVTRFHCPKEMALPKNEEEDSMVYASHPLAAMYNTTVEASWWHC